MSFRASFIGNQGRLASVGIMLLLVIALSWVYFKAESVSAERHFAYTQELRDLRELDARVDGQLMANRLEQVRNYDALTAYMQGAAQAVKFAFDVPDFLADRDRELVSDIARTLDYMLARKADLVDQFKRDNSVLRNSLAIFPVITREFLENSGHYSKNNETLDHVDKFTREVLAFSHTPSRDGLARIKAAQAEIDELSLSGDLQATITNIVRHGETISSRRLALDTLMQEIAGLRSDEFLQSLNRTYEEGHASAHAMASRYRSALYVLALLLTSFLAWLFIRLDTTRRSLAQAHGELSERYAAQLAVEKQLTLHATAFRSAHDGITLTDASGNILDVNPAFSRITGWERSEVIGRNPRVLKSGRHDLAFYQAMWKSISESDNWRGEIWNRNKYGEVYPELLSISAVRDQFGKLSNYVAVFSDIGRIKAQEKQLTKMAYYDALTELPNRTLLADRLVQGIAQTRRSQTLMTVCYLDLDGFKPINDTWGHEAGDSVLVEMANRMRSMLRGGDTVARLGGDEFVMLLLGFAHIGECESAVKRLLKQVSLPLNMLPEVVSISASVGVAIFPHDDQDPDTLLRHADQAMYRAKQEGKNCFQIFDAEQDRFTRSRHDHVARIHQALDDGEFVLYYQPKVDMRIGKVIGAEALIRWQHPERGLLPPIEFLPFVEDGDLIKWIGDWVIETALTQMEAWREAGLEVPVSVNLAGRQLQSPDFVEKLKGSLQRHPTVSTLLELEILETAALEDVVKTSRVIDDCRELGVNFSLDDFGTGYSSLTYLKRLPAKTIKIDQSFVREILSDFNNLVIVQGVIGLANAFQREVIAEGVETAEHGRLLMQLNCDHAQGYGIAKPMEADALPGWVKNWRPDPLWESIRHLHWGSIDYPLLIAEIQMRNWVAQIVYAANEGQPIQNKNPDDVTACDFGRWYYGQTQIRYMPYPVFADIEPTHRRLHEIAGRIDNAWREGRLNDCRALIPELLAARDSTMELLRELQMQVAVIRA